MHLELEGKVVIGTNIAIDGRAPWVDRLRDKGLGIG